MSQAPKQTISKVNPSATSNNQVTIKQEPHASKPSLESATSQAQKQTL